MSKEYKELIVGLDIGTSKITCVVAELKPDGRMDVIGLGTQPSSGLKKGVVVNIEATVDAISRVIQEVELMADCKIRDVYTGIAGSHIRSFNSNGMVAIKDKEVSPIDVERVIETARAMPLPADQQILHILTQEFIIDGQDGVREPIGMSGVRLEVKVHIVTGAVSAAQNIVKCVRRCGLEVLDLVLQPLASSYATLSEDEKELGVCLVDIGGGTTDLAVFTQGQGAGDRDQIRDGQAHVALGDQGQGLDAGGDAVRGEATGRQEAGCGEEDRDGQAAVFGDPGDEGGDDIGHGLGQRTVDDQMMEDDELGRAGLQEVDEGHPACKCNMTH